MTVSDDLMLGRRMLQMWDDGCDTVTISQAVGVPEPQVCRSLLILRDRRRRERAEAAEATQAGGDGKGAPATST